MHKMQIDDLSLVLDSFDDDVWESKGYYPNAILKIGNDKFRLTFFDPVRLGQDIADEMKDQAFFITENLVVVPSVNRENLEKVARLIVSTGQISLLKKL
jgi:hypothetical protein